MLSSGSKLWELQVSHQLFASSNVDIDGDGTDELVTCSWDGLVYIISTQQNVVRFQFSDPVSAFVGGAMPDVVMRSLN